MRDDLLLLLLLSGHKRLLLLSGELNDGWKCSSLRVLVFITMISINDTMRSPSHGMILDEVNLPTKNVASFARRPRIE